MGARADDEPARGGRTVPERITLAVSSLVLAVVVVLLVVQVGAGDDPPQPAATVGPTIERGDSFHVPVAVRNGGDRAAATVQVSASLTVGASTVEADQTIDFLGAGETEDLVFVFQDDPAGGELTVDVAGFAAP